MQPISMSNVEPILRLNYIGSILDIEKVSRWDEMLSRKKNV